MSEKRSPRKFHSHEGSSKDPMEYLKTVVPNQYVTYEIFDLAFKQMWAVVNKLEIQQIQCCHSDKLFELEKRILNIEDAIHNLGTFNNQIPEQLSKQVYEVNEQSKTINNLIANLNQDYQSNDSRMQSVEDAVSVLTRVVGDIQTEYEQLREQIERLDSDLLDLFKHFRSILSIEQITIELQKECKEIQKSINEIYQFI